jgi:hypothetical protein
MTRLIGTLIFNFDDTGAVERNLLAIKNSELRLSNSEIIGADPSDLGWAYSEPEMSEWSASATLNMEVDSGVPDITHEEIEKLAFKKIEFPIDFVAPTGAIYSGTAFVRNFSISSADQRVQEIRIDIRGTGILTPVTVT